MQYYSPAINASCVRVVLFPGVDSTVVLDALGVSLLLRRVVLNEVLFTPVSPQNHPTALASWPGVNFQLSRFSCLGLTDTLETDVLYVAHRA